MVIEKDIRVHDFLRGGPKWRIILGSKGQPFLNPGYVWTPYIMSTDVATVENTFSILFFYFKSLRLLF